MNFQVGDKVRVKSEYNSASGGYTYTKIGSEGVICKVTPFNSFVSVEFYKYTGPKPSNGHNVWDIPVQDLDLIKTKKTRQNPYRRIIL